MSPFDCVVLEYAVSARYVGHGVKYRPKVTENGHAERGNPPTALTFPYQGLKVSRRPGRKLWRGGWLKKQRPEVMLRIG